MHECADMSLRECIQLEAEWNIKHSRTELPIRVAMAEDGHCYASTTEFGNYLDATVTYLNPVKGLEEWDEFEKKNPNWR